MGSLLSLCLGALLVLTRADVELPSSCLGQPDGYQWMKLMDDDIDYGTTFPAIHQLCHNQYMVIDVNQDPKVMDYFSSYTSWHYALSGPDMMDYSNWEEWWLPSKEYVL